MMTRSKSLQIRLAFRSGLSVHGSRKRTCRQVTHCLPSASVYGTSADYLLGLTDIDPSDEARKQRQRLTEEEQNEMHRYEEYLLWKRKK